MIVGGRLKGVHNLSVDVDPSQVGVDDSSFLPVQSVDQNSVATDDGGVQLPVDNSQTQDMYKSVYQTDANENAKVLNLSTALNQPAPFVQKNLPAVEKAAAAPPESFFGEIEQQYPGTKKFLMDPQNMAVTHDDLPNLAQHEKLVQTMHQATTLLGAVKAGYQNSATGMLIRGQMPDTRLSPDAPIYQRLASQAASLGSDSLEMVIGGVVGAVAGGTVGAGAGAIAGTAALPVVGTVAGGAALGTIGAVGGASAGTFALPAAMKEALIQHFENGDIKDLPDFLARTRSILGESAKQGIVGLATAATGGLINKYTAGLAKPIAKALSFGGEVGAMTTAGKAVEGQAPTPTDFLEAAILVGGLHGATHVSSELVNHFIDQRKTIENQNFFKALGDSAEASKLRERMPDKYQAHISDITKNGPVENVYIPVDAMETYFQGKSIDTATAMGQLGVLDSYNEALKTGGDVQIPLSTFATKLAGTEHYQGLAPDIKFDPSDLTPREIQATQTETQDKLGQTEAQATAEGQTTESAKSVADDIATQLKAAGYTDQTAEQYSKIYESAFKTLGERANVDPRSLYEQYGLKINGADQESAFNQDSTKKPVEDSFKGQEAIDRYNAMPETRNGLVISQDTARKLYEPYAKGGESATIHVDDTSAPSQKFAEERYNEALKKPGHDPVILLAGGSSSGKTSYEQNFGKTWEGSTAVVDSTGSNYKVMKDRVEKAIAAKKPVVYSLIYRSFDKALEGNIGRYKKTGVLSPPDFMAYSHVSSIDTFIKLRDEFKDVKRPNGEPWVSFELHDNYGDNHEKPKALNVDKIDGLRYNKDGKSINSASSKLKKIAIERLENETEEVRQIREAAVQDAGSGNAGNDGSDQRGLSEAGSNASSNGEGTGQAGSDEGNQGSLNQAGDESGGARGRISFGSNRQFTIDLFKSADLSTFLHESGHFYMEILADLASKENSPQQIKDDYQTVLKWFGVDSRDQVKNEHHELWARGFEKYLMTGEAPSSALQTVFGHIRRWLTAVYKHIRSLNVEVSPEVRDVMARLLATDEEIQGAQNAISYHDDLIKNLDPKVAARVETLQDQARESAESILLKEQMSEITRKNKEFLNSERERLTIEAKKQAKELPLYSAIDELGDKKALKTAEAYLSGKLKDDGASQLIATAEIHGYGDARELATQIIDSKKNDGFNREVHARVEAGMTQHAPLMDRPAIKDEAMKAIHNEKTTEMLALEHQILRGLIQDASVNREVSKRKQVEAKVAARAALDQAKTILADKPIKNATNPRVYITAERNAAVKVAKAISRKDFEAAAKYKEQQMLSHALVSEAMKNKVEADKSIKYLTQFEKRGNDFLKMPYGFVRQVDYLLSNFGFSDKRPEDASTLIEIAKNMISNGESPEEVANSTGYRLNESNKWVPETLPDFISRVNDNYYALSVPDSVLGSEKSYNDLNLKDLRDLQNAVKVIYETGKNYNRFLGDFLKSDIREAARTFRESIAKNFGTPFADDMLAGSQHENKLSEFLAAIQRIPTTFDRVLDTMLTTTHKFDGLEEGPAKEYIYRPFENAESRKISRTAEVMKQMDAIFSKHYNLDEFSDYKNTRVNIDGRYFTKENILAMALNWGNEGNRQRIMEGFGFSQAKIETMFKELKKNDWDFVQDTWDHLQKYWPEISKLEMDVNGVEPRSVKPVAFSNEHGNYSGGYYPIKYDFERSSEAYQNNQQKDALYKQYSTAKAHTDSGHAETRVSYVKRPVLLSLDVLREHHENVIHDLEFRRAVIDANRFLAQKDVKGGIIDAVGLKGYAAINDWVKNAAGGGGEPLTMLDRAAQWFRFKTTLFNLGYRIAIAPKIAIENLINVSSEVGVSGAARAIKEYYFGESGMHDLVVGKSPFMKQRANHLDRDIGDITEKWNGKKESGFKRFAFFVHAYIDQGYSFPLWADSYKRGMAEHGNEKLAVNQADESVKRTFMSGGRVDQAAVMRGSEKQKALTTAYGYQSMMWNRFSQQRFQASMEWAQGNHLAAAAIAARSFVYTFGLPALTASVAAEFMRNNKNANENDKDKRLVARVLEEATPLKFIPVLRDMSPYLIHKALGEHTSDIHITPLEQAAQTLLDPAGEVLKSIGTGESLPNRFPEQTANALSLVTGVPKEVNDIVFNFIDWQNNNGELTWRDLLTRRTKK